MIAVRSEKVFGIGNLVLKPQTVSAFLQSIQEALVFAGLIARRMPALSEHMESMCIHPLMYVTQWYV
jgi:hypothetical protein